MATSSPLSRRRLLGGVAKTGAGAALGAGLVSATLADTLAAKRAPAVLRRQDGGRLVY